MQVSARKIPTVYNLSWFSKAVATKENPAGMPKGQTGGVISDQKTTPAIILYPVLATPEILVGDDNLEMLLLLKKDEGPEKLKVRITNQLKISQGLDPEKKCPGPGVVCGLERPVRGVLKRWVAQRQEARFFTG